MVSDNLYSVCSQRWNVLILVVMEYGLRLLSARLVKASMTGLNPCCNGIWSQTGIIHFDGEVSRELVLILVVMEYGLRHGGDGEGQGVWGS